MTMANATTNAPTNVFTYHRRNLFLAYGIALFFAFIANLLGGFAYFSNGESHDNTFSAIFCSTRDIHIANLNVHERSGALPLKPEVAKMQIIYGKGYDGAWGFRVERKSED